VLGVKVVVSVLLGALVCAPAAFAGPSLKIGAVEDAAKWGAPDTKMALAQQAGFDSIRLTAQWSAGMTAPNAADVTALQGAAAAAVARHITPVVAIYNTGSSSTPADAAAHVQFVSFVRAVVTALPQVPTFIIGNEPNSNLYWLPQFDSAGTDVAAVAYEQLLAASYDAVKAVRATATVVGGALEPRGSDNPSAAKQTHSPTAFIRDLGAAYRASGRTTPIMDVFDEHVYADTSALPPSMAHPSTTTIAEADYPKLVALLGQAFDGTAQPGSSLPILYGEFGVESAIPSAKSAAYTGNEVAATVDEATQAAYYIQAFKLALCQPNVIGILDFHVSDEGALAGWQSGVYYANDTPKSSLAAVRDAAAAARAGTLTTCPDAVAPTVSMTATGGSALAVSATASDDVGVGKVELLTNGAVVATKYAPPYTFTWRPAQDGTFTVSVRATDAAGNASAATATATIDVTPPKTTLNGQDGVYEFIASEPATFACSVDGAAYAPCASPVSYSSLVAGGHTLSVRATDSVGNVEPAPPTAAFTIAAQPPPPTPVPAPAPAPATGGGGGGLPPDVAVALAADPSPLTAGSELLYRLSVSMTNAGSATGVQLTLQLPDGVDYVRSYANRGPGCTAAGATITCDLAWLSPPYVAQVTIWTTLRTPGHLVATATVREDQADVNAADNTAGVVLETPIPTLRPTQAAPLPPVLPKLVGRPVVGTTLRVSGASGRPAWRVCSPRTCVSAGRGTTLTVRRAWVGRRIIVVIGRTTLRSAPVHKR
jgi:hypothetical protein